MLLICMQRYKKCYANDTNGFVISKGLDNFEGMLTEKQGVISHRLCHRGCNLGVGSVC